LYTKGNFTRYYYSDESMRTRGSGHVTSMGEIRNGYKMLLGKPEGRDTLIELELDGRKI
jgi:hypothetical protein